MFPVISYDLLIGKPRILEGVGARRTGASWTNSCVGQNVKLGFQAVPVSTAGVLHMLL